MVHDDGGHAQRARLMQDALIGIARKNQAADVRRRDKLAQTLSLPQNFKDQMKFMFRAFLLNDAQNRRVERVVDAQAEAFVCRHDKAQIPPAGIGNGLRLVRLDAGALHICTGAGLAHDHSRRRQNIQRPANRNPVDAEHGTELPFRRQGRCQRVYTIFNITGKRVVYLPVQRGGQRFVDHSITP